ncbi:S8 family peptidase [Dactylosporangium sp. CS-033363]|uniref:S8 family peptidase n=1 Tax=Dactylosporangium sp. CS-033363 TaxID=3239935 RepID=UPI003D8D5FB2
MVDNPDELVVDLLHLKVVEDMLERLDIPYNPIADSDRDERLGLALVRGIASMDVGEALAIVRQRCAAERDGWMPTMGRNRDVEAVVGESHKPMDGGPPGFVEGPVTIAPLGAPVDETSGRGVRVGVIDTKPAPPGTDPVPYRSGHAIFVKSLIKAYAPGAEIVELALLDSVTARASSWETARAIMDLAADPDRPLDILNLSLGCYTLAGGPPLVIARAIERIGANVLVVAAAGNHGLFETLTKGRDKHSATWPAAIPPVVAVGALDGNGAVPDWSAKLPWVQYAAPGVAIVAEYLNEAEVELPEGRQKFTGAASWSGTSFAAAIASGAIAARTIPGSRTPLEALEKMTGPDGGGPVRRL